MSVSSGTRSGSVWYGAMGSGVGYKIADRTLVTVSLRVLWVCIGGVRNGKQWLDPAGRGLQNSR